MTVPKDTLQRDDAKRFKRALIEAIAKKSKGRDKWSALTDIAEKLVQHALDGEGWATLAIRDTLDGKPAQALTGPNGEGLTVNILTGLGGEPPKRR